MSTLLRPSTRQAARLASFSLLRNSAQSRSSVRIARQWQAAPLCLRQAQGRYGVQRYYSTEPSKQPDEKASAEGKDAEKEADEPLQRAGTFRPRSRPEQYNMSSKDDKPQNDSNSNKPKNRRPLPDGFVYLSDAEIHALRTWNKNGPNIGKFAEEKFETFVKDVQVMGAPQELRDLIHKGETEGLGLADTLRAFKVVTKMTDRLAQDRELFEQTRDRYFNKDDKTDFTSNDTKRQNEGEESLKQKQEQSQEDVDAQMKQKLKEEREKMYEDQNKQHGQQGGQQRRQGGQGSKQQNGQWFNREIKSTDLLNWALIAAVGYPFYSMFFEGSSRDISWQELRRTFLDKGLVEKLVVVNDKVRVELNQEAVRSVYPDSVATNPGFRYYVNIGSIDVFERQLDDAQNELGIPSNERIPVSYLKPSTSTKFLMAYGPTLLVVGILIYFTRRMGSGGLGGGGSGGVFGVGKSKAKRFNHESAVKVKFSDVAGMDEAKLEIMEFVSFLKTPDRFQKLGAKIPRGAILAGPPGTGKTLLAKATAGESGVPFFSVSGSEFVEMFVGVGASRVRDLFQTARKSAPCIIFIDEIDAIGKARNEGARFGGDSEREATLNQILTEMDGFNTTEQVVVLAGTNRPDILDKALMRPGRFDRHIHIDAPTMAGRTDIFKVHLARIVTSENMEFLAGRLAALTPGFSGADIANAVNEAALVAARANATTVAMIHFEQAIERVVGGLERKSLVLDAHDRRVVAYHEAGHAICGWYFKYADPLLKVSIIPRAKGTLGYAQYLPGDAYLMNRYQLMDRMAMALGGRISEEIHFDTVTTGASDDFKKVTAMATNMVTQWGMSDKVGPLHFQHDQNQFQKPFAESTAQTIDAEVRKIIDGAYEQCKNLLVEKKAEVGKIAEELLRKEVLDRDDMIRILGKRPFEDKEEFQKYFDGTRGGVPPFRKEQTDEPPPATGDAPAPALFKGTEGEVR